MASSNSKIAFQLAYPGSSEIHDVVITNTTGALQKIKIPGSSAVLAYHLEWCTCQLHAFTKARQTSLNNKAFDSDLDSLEQELRDLITDLENLKDQYQQSGVPVPIITVSQMHLRNGPPYLLSQPEDCWPVATEEELDNIEKDIIRQALSGE